MKVIVRLLFAISVSISSCFGQIDQKTKQFEKDFKEVATVYEQNLKPRLRQFARIQVGPAQSSDSSVYRALIESRYLVFLQKAEMLRDEQHEYLIKQLAQKSYNRVDLVQFFTFSYQNHFPGLDYTFFQQVEDILIPKKK